MGPLAWRGNIQHAPGTGPQYSRELRTAGIMVLSMYAGARRRSFERDIGSAAQRGNSVVPRLVPGAVPASADSNPFRSRKRRVPQCQPADNPPLDRVPVHRLEIHESPQLSGLGRTTGHAVPPQLPHKARPAAEGNP